MSRKILVIDDSPTLRKLLQHFLEKLGYIVRVAYNGKVGLKCISGEVFDLIILDMKMPVLDGAKVLEELKKMDDFKTPILILSASKEEESKAIGISLGASYYMTKPFKPPEVIARIEEIFKKESRKT